VTKVTEALNLIIHVDPRLTGLMTGYDGGDGVEAKPTTKRDDHPPTALLLFVVTDTAQPRHLRHKREKNKMERPVGRVLRARDGVRDGVASRVRDFVNFGRSAAARRYRPPMRPTVCLAGRQAPPERASRGFGRPWLHWRLQAGLCGPREVRGYHCGCSKGPGTTSE
jgi:hypothetical protein